MNGIDFSQNDDYFWFYSQPIRLPKSQDAQMVLDNKACNSRLEVGSRFIMDYAMLSKLCQCVRRLTIRNSKCESVWQSGIVLVA